MKRGNSKFSGTISSKTILRNRDNFELNFNKKIIASIFAIILTNVAVKTLTIISVKLRRQLGTRLDNQHKKEIILNEAKILLHKQSSWDLNKIKLKGQIKQLRATGGTR